MPSGAASTLAAPASSSIPKQPQSMSLLSQRSKYMRASASITQRGGAGPSSSRAPGSISSGGEKKKSAKREKETDKRKTEASSPSPPTDDVPSLETQPPPPAPSVSFSPPPTQIKSSPCPICSRLISDDKINDHVNRCLDGEVTSDEEKEDRRESLVTPIVSQKQTGNEKLVDEYEVSVLAMLDSDSSSDSASSSDEDDSSHRLGNIAAASVASNDWVTAQEVLEVPDLRSQSAHGNCVHSRELSRSQSFQ